VKIATTNGSDDATAGGLASSDCAPETGNTPSSSVTTLVLVRQNARHLFEPRTPEMEMAAPPSCSSEGAVVGCSVEELIVVQDECAGCLPLAAMLRAPHRLAENQPIISPAVAPSPETGARCG